MQGLTIAGTHTNCGKTFTACALLHYYNQQGSKTVGFKPIASGSEWLDHNWQNQDTLLLQAASSISCSIKEMTPFMYRAAISPHFAAKTEGHPQCTAASILEAHQHLLQKQPDIVIAETAGGLLSPLSDQLTSLDLCKILGYPVVLVVEIELGCLNAAQLSWQCLQHHQVPCLGWIANFKNPYLPARYAIVNDLCIRLACPPLLCFKEQQLHLLNQGLKCLPSL